MEKQTFILKKSGDKLSAAEWNNLTSYVNEVVDEVTNNSDDNELEENLVNSTLHPSANEEKNILDIHLNSYFTFDLTLLGLQNPVTQELINTFKSLNNNILINSFDIGYLELSVIQDIMNERSVITPADITNLANTTIYEIQSGLTSLTNLRLDLDELPNYRFFKLICSDGILLGLKISGDIVFNEGRFGRIPLSEIMIVTSHFFPTILENPNIPWSALPGVVNKLKSFAIPYAYYVISKALPTYFNIYGGRINNPVGVEAEVGESSPSVGNGISIGNGPSVGGNLGSNPTPSQQSYTEYLKTKYIGANSLNPGGTCTYIYSTDLEKFFNISVVDGNYGSIGLNLLNFLSKLLNSEYTIFKYNNTDYIIIPSHDIIDDIVIISPKYAGKLGKQSDDVKLSDLVTIVNLMKNQTGPWASQS